MKSIIHCVLTEGQNTVTRVEVKMTDGKTHVSSLVPPDIAHIVSMMPPEIFSPKCLPLQVCFNHLSSSKSGSLDGYFVLLFFVLFDGDYGLLTLTAYNRDSGSI